MKRDPLSQNAKKRRNSKQKKFLNWFLITISSSIISIRQKHNLSRSAGKLNLTKLYARKLYLIGQKNLT